MKLEERRKRILELLQAMQKELRVEDLAEMLGVSQLTIRRDLDELATGKTIIRTHGGCLAVGRAALETEYHQKVAENFELKRAIGAAAVERVLPGQHVLLNDGSTTFHLATQFTGRGPFTVTTN
jgi:DeoR family transcriptional regulator, fructose operon transcriptional repressor